jgi:hypothetical protein
MVYAFALQTSKLRSDYDALNLSQWKFWLAPRAALEALNQKSMVLSTVEWNFGLGFDFADMPSRFHNMLRDIV